MFDHVTIRASQLEQSRTFYETALALLSSASTLAARSTWSGEIYRSRSVETTSR
jgi:catechol 2,3-dioxygenase-like lactoylglutathione lyase family enzyme